jgi:hypothetical protein
MDYHVSLRCVCSISAQRQNVGAHHLIAIVALASAIESPPELSRVFNSEGLLSEIVRHRMIKLDCIANSTPVFLDLPISNCPLKKIEVVLS